MADHTSIVSCYASHVPLHVAVSLVGPLNQIMIYSAPSAEAGFAYPDKAYPDKQVSIWSFRPAWEQVVLITWYSTRSVPDLLI